MRRITRLYGAHPLHGLLMLSGLAFVGYLLSILIHVGNRGWLAIWLVGAIAAHDVILFPLYAAGDRALGMLRSRSASTARRVPIVNHVRVPVVLSGILLLMTFPLVFRLSEHVYFRATGQHTSVYFLRWVLISAAFFAGSAVIYLARLVMAYRPIPLSPGRR
jgi:hypothetical protein